MKCYVCKSPRANRKQTHFDGTEVIVCEDCFVTDKIKEMYYQFYS